MRRMNPMLLIDFYKGVHAEMLPKGISKSVSYFTPRMSRVNRWDKVVMFELQGFIKKRVQSTSERSKSGIESNEGTN